MKKVLFVMNTMGRGGAEMALLELLRRLAEKELEIHLYVLTGQGELTKQLPANVKILNKEYSENSVLTPEGKKMLAKTSLKALLRRGNVIRLFPYLFKQTIIMLRKGKLMPDKLLWRVLSDGAERFEEEYDLAVAYIEGGSTYYVADHVKAKKKVAFFHTDYKMAGYSRSLDKNVYLEYDKIFPVSAEVKETLSKIYPECAERMVVFQNLINQDRIRQMAAQEGGFADEFDGYRILTVGRLVSLKDFPQSIQAMKLLKDKGVKARWYILGEGEQREELEKLIRKLGLERDFYLPGVTDNPYAYMAQADIYVHATRYEGKSIAIQEAQILERPILVSDCSGNREQVVHGKDGLMCELTPEAICEGVMMLLNNPQKCKEYGREAAKRHTTGDTEIDKLLSLL